MFYGQFSLRDWRSLCVLRSTQPTRLEVTLRPMVNSAYETGGHSVFYETGGHSLFYGQLSLRDLWSTQPTRLEVTLCPTVNSAYETRGHSVFYGQLSLRDWRIFCVLYAVFSAIFALVCFPGSLPATWLFPGKSASHLVVSREVCQPPGCFRHGQARPHSPHFYRTLPQCILLRFFFLSAKQRSNDRSHCSKTGLDKLSP